MCKSISSFTVNAKKKKKKKQKPKQTAASGNWCSCLGFVPALLPTPRAPYTRAQWLGCSHRSGSNGTASWPDEGLQLRHKCSRLRQHSGQQRGNYDHYLHLRLKKLLNHLNGLVQTASWNGIFSSPVLSCADWLRPVELQDLATQ